MNIRQSKLQYVQWNSDFRNAKNQHEVGINHLRCDLSWQNLRFRIRQVRDLVSYQEFFFWATSESGSSCNFSFKIHEHMTKCPTWSMIRFELTDLDPDPVHFLNTIRSVRQRLGGPLEMCLLIHKQTTKYPWSVWTPGSGSGSYYPECPAAPGGAYIACLGGSGERRTGVHPGAITGRLVAGRGVAAHVGGAGRWPHRRTPPWGRRAQVRLYRVPVLLLTVNFAAKNARKVVFEVLTAGIFYLIKLAFILCP
jgi:hypothetical protein